MLLMIEVLPQWSVLSDFNLMMRNKISVTNICEDQSCIASKLFTPRRTLLHAHILHQIHIHASKSQVFLH